MRTEQISQLSHFYRPQRSWGKVIFSQASVILLTGGVRGGGMCMVARGVCMVAPVGGVRGFFGGHAWFFPGGGMHRIRQDTVNERAVHILLECILVKKTFFSFKNKNIFQCKNILLTKFSRNLINMKKRLPKMHFILAMHRHIHGNWRGRSRARGQG